MGFSIRPAVTQFRYIPHRSKMESDIFDEWKIGALVARTLIVPTLLVLLSITYILPSNDYYVAIDKSNISQARSL